MSALSEIEIRQIRDATVRDVIRWLTKGARDPERIGRRVLAYEHKLFLNAQGEKLLTLAKRLNVSKARASVAVADAEAALFEIRKVNPGGPLKESARECEREKHAI